MSAEKVREYLDKRNIADRITVHTETIDTVEHAAQQIGCSEAEIAKTLSFIVEEKPVIVVMAGDGRVNSSKFKGQFHTKPSMIPREKVEELTGFVPGGVCPFGVPEGIPSTILNGAKIGENCIIGAGSLVTQNKEIPDGMLAYGNPVKVIRPLTEKEIADNKESAEHYVKLMNGYLKGKGAIRWNLRK